MTDLCDTCGKEFASEYIALPLHRQWFQPRGGRGRWYRIRHRIRLYEANGRLHLHILDAPLPEPVVVYPEPEESTPERIEIYEAVPLGRGLL